jgi:hypothetical protein
VGVLRYPLHCLTKSGLWAGYAAHGVPTVLVAERQPAETLEEDRHFVLLDALAGEIPDKSKRSSMSREVKRWYDEQGRSRHAARMALRVLPTFSSEAMHD